MLVPASPHIYCLALLGASVALAGCGADPGSDSADDPASPDAPAAAIGEDATVTPVSDLSGAGPECPVVDSRDWTARIEGKALFVSGEVDLPTPGYTVTWTKGPADRRLPPAQHLVLEFTAPDGMVAQVIDTMTVEYEGSADYPEYRSILVRCGNQVLAAVVDIESS